MNIAILRGTPADSAIIELPKLYSYVVARDYGFAPNPFYGFCTLSPCKPRLREGASIGAWIFGTRSTVSQRNGHIVFAMQVCEVMSFDDYWGDIRFRNKRPSMYGSKKQAFGDNIYHKDKNTRQWRQIDSHHSYSEGKMNYRNINHDTKIDRVLVSDKFVYFGGSGPRLPKFAGVYICKKGPGHKCRFPECVIVKFIEWFDGLDAEGYCGEPLNWKESWSHATS